MELSQATSRLPTCLILAFTALFITSCGGCNSGKGGRFNSGGRGGAAPQPAPAPGPGGEPQAPAPSPGPVQDVGETVPPITSDKVATINTEKEAGLKHLVFETTSTAEAGRHLTEFLVVVRANEQSCIRLKTRPTGGLTEEIKDDLLKGGVEGKGACEGQKFGGEQENAGGDQPAGDQPAGDQPAGDQPAEEPKAEFALGESPLERASLAKSFAWEFPDGALPTRGLAAQTAALCAPRLFRMEADGNLGTVVEKTGRLIHIGTNVRVWLDDEFANVCTGGTDLSSRTPIAFGPLIQDGFAPATWKDKLDPAHVINLASALDRSISDLTGRYGPLSDIDSSGYIEIFMSPDVNRKYFVKYEAGQVDDFRARLIFRPQDLAFYNSQTNPLSNEGEILYLWVPDPAGIYNGVQYPSGNSIASNYAKGYLSAQAMTLIIANQRLFVQKLATMEDRWLTEALSLLAASYAAGNDFPVMALSQYLTSRPQYLDLVTDTAAALVTQEYQSMAFDELTGMRGIFGWYLHARLCGADSSKPCDKIKSILDQKLVGKANIEAVFGEKFDKTLEHFGLSVGVSLLEKPNDALAFWDKGMQGLPLKPILLPDLAEILKDSPPTTVEEDNFGSLLGIDATDRTVAGPFPNKNPVLFQVFSSDNDMEFKIAKDSVTYVLVTALLDEKNDVTGLFGKGLSVTFIPTGERDPELRRIHIEKVSEQAHSDLRPDNLTPFVDPKKSYMYPKVYDSLDFSITPSRDVWVLGSTDNFDVNVEGENKEIGDSDAFNFYINPCEGVADVPTCQARKHGVLVQVQIRDFEKELAPMLIVTETDRAIFQGYGVVGRVSTLDPDVDKNEKAVNPVMCQAEISWPTGTVTLNAVTNTVLLNNHGYATNDVIQLSPAPAYSNGDPIVANVPYGLTPFKDYLVRSIDANSFALKLTTGGADIDFEAVDAGVTVQIHDGRHGFCANGGFPGYNVHSGALTIQDPDAWAHPYYNFLSLGSLGYPFTSQNTITYADIDECPGVRCFRVGEADRQYFKFTLDDEMTPTVYSLYGVRQDLPPPTDGRRFLDSAEIGILASIKSRLENQATCTTDQTFVESCLSVEVETCSLVCDPSDVQRQAVRNDVASFVQNNTASLLCGAGDNCTDMRFLISMGPGNTDEFVPPSHFYYYETRAATFSAFQPPIESIVTSSVYRVPSSGAAYNAYALQRYCQGDPSFYPTQLNTRCNVVKESVGAIKDIRQQFTVDSALLRAGNCKGAAFGTDYKVCLDPIAVDREFFPKDPYKFDFVGEVLPSDRQYAQYTMTPPFSDPARRRLPIAVRAGEVIGKPERLQSIYTTVPGTGTVLNVIVGGRGNSQGKYMLRVQLREFL